MLRKKKGYTQAATREWSNEAVEEEMVLYKIIETVETESGSLRNLGNLIPVVSTGNSSNI